MSRWIDSDALIDYLDYCVKEGMGTPLGIAIKHIVEDRPSIDIVMCAECKNCKRRLGAFKGEPIFFYRCAEHNREVESDDFCSWGERRE